MTEVLALSACPCGDRRLAIVEPGWWRCWTCGVQRTGTELEQRSE